MDWPEAVNNALARADERVVSFAVIVVIVGGAVAVVSKARELLGAKLGSAAPSPPPTMSDLKALFVEMEQRFNIRAERIEVRMDGLSKEGHDRDVAIARIEVRLELDPLVTRKERTQ